MFDFLKRKPKEDTAQNTMPASSVHPGLNYPTSEERLKHFRKAVEEVAQLRHENYLPVVYQYLASESDEVVNEAARVISEYVENHSFSGIMRLNESFRSHTSIDYTVNWREVSLEELEKRIKDKGSYLWVLRLGTFHPNGYFREKCIRELQKESSSLGFLILRLNDWVEPVRRAAEDTCADLSRFPLDELMWALPYFEKTRQGERRNPFFLEKLEKNLVSAIREKFGEITWGKIRGYEFLVRKTFYRLFMKEKRLSKAEVEDILSKERSAQCQMQIMPLFVEQYALTVEELDGYLKHKSRLVQRGALEQKYKILGGPWEGMEDLLLSPSSSIRESARYILKKHTDIDIRKYYLDHLESTRILVKKVCILGIGENGKKEDAVLLEKYLDDANPQVVKCAMHAIGSLIGYDAKEIFWRFLTGSDLTLVVQAYREICAHGICFGAKNIYELFCKAEDPVVKKKMAVLLNREPYWERLPYALMHYRDSDDDIEEMARRGVNRKKNMYAKVSKEDAGRILSILRDEKYRIPESVKKTIEFDLKVVTK